MTRTEKNAYRIVVLIALGLIAYGSFTASTKQSVGCIAAGVSIIVLVVVIWRNENKHAETLRLEGLASAVKDVQNAFYDLYGHTGYNRFIEIKEKLQEGHFTKTEFILRGPGGEERCRVTLEGFLLPSGEAMLRLSTNHSSFRERVFGKMEYQRAADYIMQVTKSQLEHYVRA